MTREVYESLQILKIEVLPGNIKTFRVYLGSGNVVTGVVVVDAAKLADRRQFDRASLDQINCMLPSMKEGVWNATVNKALRLAPEPAPPETERMHRYGTASWGSEETRWLVHNRIPELGYGSLVGSTSTYKSFHLLEMAGCVITGTKYLKAPVRRPGGVLILAPEGAQDIPMRWAAWVKHKMNPDLFRPGNKLPFTYNGHCRPLVQPSTVDWIVKVAQEEQAYFQNEFGVDLVLIGIDTLTAAAGWVNENDSAEGQMIMNNLSAVSSACKNFVMTADHYGKDESAEARGTSVKITSPPSLLYTRGGLEPSIALRKSRSGPQGLVFPCEMRTVEMGTDSFGDPQTSLVINWDVTREQRRPQRPSGARSVFDQALTETFRSHKENITVDGAAVDAVREFHLRGAFKRLYKAHKQGGNPEREVTSHAINTAWNRAVEKVEGRTLKRTTTVDGAGFFYHPPPI